MDRGRNILLFVATLSLSVLATGQPSHGGCGCSGLPVPSCYGRSATVHTHYHCCCRSCQRPRDRDRGAQRVAQADYRVSAPVPVVSSMPVFSTPMMMASVPVMPTVATRSAQPNMRSAMDCCERLDRLEKNVKDIADAMVELQGIVKDQTRAMAAITRRLDGDSK